VSAPTVAVVGPGVASSDEERTAEEVGRLLAARGVTVVTGGLGGVMAAASRGARQAGGHTLGLLPGSDRADANPWVEHAVPTGLGEARNTLVVRASHAVIAVGGAYGTLSEIAFALKLGVPVVGLDTWELHRRGARDPGILAVSSPAEAVEVACAALTS
jgi:uncharacterized protein (TIGR00725 family)